MLALLIPRRDPMRPTVGKGGAGGLTAEPAFPLLVKTRPEEGAAAHSASARRDEQLWQNTSGIIHLPPRVPRGRSLPYAAADPCQNGLQAGSCIIFPACPRSKWRLSLLVSLSGNELGQISPRRGKCSHSSPARPPASNNNYPSLCVHCSLHSCSWKLNAQLQHSPSNINLAPSHASIINVCIAAEDSCIAPSQRITAPALSFLKRWQHGWRFCPGGGGVEQRSRENILQPKPP